MFNSSISAHISISFYSLQHLFVLPYNRPGLNEHWQFQVRLDKTLIVEILILGIGIDLSLIGTVLDHFSTI